MHINKSQDVLQKYTVWEALVRRQSGAGTAFPHGKLRVVSVWVAVCAVCVMTLELRHFFFWHISSLQSFGPMVTKLWSSDHWWSKRLWRVVPSWPAEPC